jgi:hypothetical protein
MAPLVDPIANGTIFGRHWHHLRVAIAIGTIGIIGNCLWSVVTIGTI